jgi:hypothetical protein
VHSKPICCHSVYKCLTQSVEANSNAILLKSHTIFVFQTVTLSQFNITFRIPFDCTTIQAVEIALLDKTRVN